MRLYNSKRYETNRNEVTQTLTTILHFGRLDRRSYHVTCEGTARLALEALLPNLTSSAYNEQSLRIH
jgi:hypothetical protein